MLMQFEWHEVGLHQIFCSKQNTLAFVAMYKPIHTNGLKNQSYLIQNGENTMENQTDTSRNTVSPLVIV